VACYRTAGGSLSFAVCEGYISRNEMMKRAKNNVMGSTMLVVVVIYPTTYLVVDSQYVASFSRTPEVVVYGPSFMAILLN